MWRGYGYAQRTGVTERTTVGRDGIGRTGSVGYVTLTILQLLSVIERSIGGVWRGRVRVHDARSFLDISHGGCRWYRAWGEWSAGVVEVVYSEEKTRARQKARL